MITLANAEHLHKKHPDSFWIPDPLTRQTLKVGQFAQLIFEGGELTERMWVKITSADRGNYEGILTNTPASSKYLELVNEPLQFRSEHVINTFTES